MKHLKLLAPLALSLLLGSALAAPTALNISATEKGYDAPASVQAGYVALTFTNSGKMPVDIGFFRLKPGVTEDQFKAAGTAVATEASKDASYNLNQLVEVAGGVGDVQPGKSDAATLHLTPGTYILTSLDADEKTHVTALSQGYYQSFTVTGPELANAPDKADYAINMVDYRFELPTDVTAGSHSFHITNSGQEPHFTLMAKMLPGKTMDDVMKALMSNDQSGPPPVDFDHSLFAQVLTTGQAEDVTWNLESGNYAVVCFVESKDGTPHAAMGMAQELVVK